MIQDTQVANAESSGDPCDTRVVLESRGLKKTYGSGEKCIQVLVDANLTLRQGEMIAIVAPSGAGGIPESCGGIFVATPPVAAGFYGCGKRSHAAVVAR